MVDRAVFIQVCGEVDVEALHLTCELARVHRVRVGQ
jgi:hypothetical protein